MEGFFQGTDDKGLQGEAIVMDRHSFEQGMSHDEALKKGTRFSELPSNYNHDFVERIEKNQARLTERPDYDGFVTINEGIEWAKAYPNAYSENPNTALYIDASKLDFGSVSVDDFPSEGSTIRVNLLYKTKWTDFVTGSKKAKATAYAYGNTSLTLVNAENRSVSVGRDAYDWNYNKGRSFKNKVRSTLITIERIRAGVGEKHGIQIHTYGLGTLNN